MKGFQSRETLVIQISRPSELAVIPIISLQLKNR